MMNAKGWITRSAVGLGLWAIAASVAIAQSPTETLERPAEQTAPPSAVESPSSEMFETYILPETFSVEIPAGWVAEGAEDEGYAVITSYASDATPELADVKTEVTLVNESPNTFVGREIDDLIQQGYVIDQYGLAAVGGNEAFRLWIIELPGEFANQVITFVGFGDSSTAKIVSYFNDDSSSTKDIILQIHRSFELIPEEE